MTQIVARWCAWDQSGLEEARITFDDAGMRAKGEISAEAGERPWCRYVVEADPAWRTRVVRVELADGRRVDLASDGQGAWTRDGQPAPGLQGAIDVDLSGTPLTNVLPVRRLHLGIGDRARITCAYVDLPSLDVRPEGQRYTRLASQRYHFEAAAHGFARDIDVDDDGLVVSYPGLFRRVG